MRIIQRTRQRLTEWYHDLSDQWKATLRTSFATVIGSIGLCVLAILNTALNVVNTGNVDVIGDMANAGRVLVTSLLSVAVGLVTFAMNRHGRGARYGTVVEVQVDAPDIEADPLARLPQRQRQRRRRI